MLDRLPLSRAEGNRPAAPALWRGAAVLEIPGVRCALSGWNIETGMSFGFFIDCTVAECGKYDACPRVFRQKLR